MNIFQKNQYICIHQIHRQNEKIIVTLSVVALFACQKDPVVGPQGAQGPQGPSGSNVLKEGFINGSLVGKKTDGSSLNETFNYEYYDSPDFSSGSIRYNPDGKSVNVSIARFDQDFKGRVYFDFVMDSINANSANTSKRYSLEYRYVKPITTNNYFYFDVEAYYSGTPSPKVDTVTVTNINYSSSTGILSGSYKAIVDTSHTSTNYPAVITGAFQVKPDIYKQ